MNMIRKAQSHGEREREWVVCADIRDGEVRRVYILFEKNGTVFVRCGVKGEIFVRVQWLLE